MLLFAEASSQATLPKDTGDSRIDWINMLGWLFSILVSGGIALGLNKRKPAMNEDITLIKAAIDSEKSRLNEVKARLIKIEALADAVTSLRSAIENRTLVEGHIAERVNGIERRIESDLHEIKDRLGDGDGDFRERAKEIAALRETVAGMDSTVKAMSVAMNLIQQSHQQMLAAAKSWRT